MSRQAPSETNGIAVMNLIAHLDQHELGYFSDKDEEIARRRNTARAVLVNADGQVAVACFRKSGRYFLPGGGVDDGETPEQALRREIREEVGYEITDIVSIGIVEEYRHFRGMHQTAHCFTARVTQFVGTQLTEHEIAQGMEVLWVDSVEAAIEIITSDGSLLTKETHDVGRQMARLRETAILKAAEKKLASVKYA